MIFLKSLLFAIYKIICLYFKEQNRKFTTKTNKRYKFERWRGEGSVYCYYGGLIKNRLKRVPHCFRVYLAICGVEKNDFLKRPRWIEYFLCD